MKQHNIMCPSKLIICFWTTRTKKKRTTNGEDQIRNNKRERSTEKYTKVRKSRRKDEMRNKGKRTKRTIKKKFETTIRKDRVERKLWGWLNKRQRIVIERGIIGNKINKKMSKNKNAIKNKKELI